MITSAKAFKRFGPPGLPTEGRYMTLLEIPADVREAMPVLPLRVYCNQQLVKPFLAALRALVAAGLAHELKEWNGCYVVRKKRGLKTMSLHSWGLAVDVNRSTNELGRTPTLSPGFVACFTANGFDWGGTWKRLDGMHFQLSTLS